MITSVFLGPTMGLEVARAIFPDAVFHPPAEQGDLLAAVDFDGAGAIGLIDGTFHQNLSVWHNEVCYLLSMGILIYGSSSMGALRAAETHRFGMIGVGRVYEWFRDGVISADDEVALMHGDAASGFVPLSHPLVNVRASIGKAVSHGLLDDTYASYAIELARGLHYPDRQIATIVRLCSEAGFPAAQSQGVERALTAEYVDIKQADAKEMLAVLLSAVRSTPETPTLPTFDFARSSVFETMYNLDRRVGGWESRTTLQQVAERFAVDSPDHQELRRASLHRELAVFFGNLLGVQVSPDELEAERTTFLERQSLNSPEALKDWLQVNALRDADLEEYLAEETLCRRLRRWIQSAQSFDRGAKSVLNELRMRGQFPAWVESAVENGLITAAYGETPEYADLANQDPALLAQKHAAATGVRVTGDATVWAEAAGFESANALADALRESEIARLVKSRIARLLAGIERERVAED